MAPILRILARVLAGALIGAGYISHGTAESIFADPAFDMALGTLIWAGTEAFYWMARRFGWRT